MVEEITPQQCRLRDMTSVGDGQRVWVELEGARVGRGWGSWERLSSVVWSKTFSVCLRCPASCVTRLWNSGLLRRSHLRYAAPITVDVEYTRGKEIVRRVGKDGQVRDYHPDGVSCVVPYWTKA